MRRLLILVFAMAVFPASAHKASDAYLNLAVEGSRVHGRWDIAVQDLALIAPLDSNRDHQITWGELHEQSSRLFRLLADELAIAGDGEGCPLGFHRLQITEHSDGFYGVFEFTAACRDLPRNLTIDYGFLFDVDARHKGLLHLAEPASSVIFSKDTRRHLLSLGNPSFRQTAGDYFVVGVRHILAGYDHLLFLLTLLLPVAFVRHHRHWQRRELGSALFEAVRIVTAFTLAHTLTLSLSVLGHLQFSGPWVEVMIAASIAIAAVHNLFPRWHRWLWLLTFVFGLVHGLGFAGVLEALGLPPGEKVLPLLSFNLGVEAGQLLVVGLLLPLLVFLSRVRLYPRIAVQGGSVAIVVIALYWMVDRLAFAA